MLSSDDSPKPHGRFLNTALSQDDDIIGRIPPNSDKLLENLPWLNIMSELAITAAIAEYKVYFFSKRVIKKITLQLISYIRLPTI